MPTGVLRQSKHQRLPAFIARLAEGRKPSGMQLPTYRTARAVPLIYFDRRTGRLAPCR